MITPFNMDVEKASDDEILAAYAKDGLTDEQARANLDVIRGRFDD